MPKVQTLYRDEKYGKLTVIDTTTDRKVSCLCECGNIVSVLKHNLTSGRTKSCGKGICQSHFKDLVGQTFGYLLVKEVAKFDKDHGTIWKCQCICGKEHFTRGNSLLSGHTKSCGCKSAELNSIATSKDPGLSNVVQLFNTYKNQARLRGYSFELSLKYFRKLIADDCYYCGIEPLQKIVISNILGDRILLYNGIDRIDNTKGYIIDNVISSCGMCNIAKKDLSFDEFVLWIDRTYKHLLKKKLSNMESSL